MAKHAAFLRGVNLGSNRRVSAEQLRSLFAEMGFGGVGTFRTSGNVVFEADREARAKLTKRIERALAEALGWEVTVFLRTAEEVRSIAAQEPFDRKLVEASAGKLQVAMLPAKPAASKRAQALAHATGEDLLACSGRELYWLPRAGISDSGLDLKAVEALLGPTTMRTMGTIEKLAEKYLV